MPITPEIVRINAPPVQLTDEITFTFSNIIHVTKLDMYEA